MQACTRRRCASSVGVGQTAARVAAARLPRAMLRVRASASPAAGQATPRQHVVLAPPASNRAPGESECLLVIAPGVGLGPDDFASLAQAAQAEAPHVRLWVSCMALDYASLAVAMQAAGGPGSPETAAVLEGLLSEVKEAAAAQGFKPRTAGWGRCTNLYLCAQSAAGVTLSEAAFKAASGLILLASALDGRYSLGKLPSLEDWGRPVMVLGGELDGQLRWPWQAGLAADAAVIAQKAGPYFAAAHHPFILVPGASHGQTSNGATNHARGDIDPHTSDAAAQREFGRAIGAFLTAHEGDGCSNRQAAADSLLGMVRQTAELIAPYFMACGMGDICAAWVTGRQGGPESTASLDIDTTHHSSSSSSSATAQHVASHLASPLQQPLLQGTRREAGAKVSAALHPGLLQKAERFVAAAQLRLAASLPREVQGRLRVVVQTHTELEALLYNQPRVAEQPDGSVIVLVHALLALPNIVRPGSPLPSCKPAAPELWMKLKRPQGIADELGLEGAFADASSAAALNKGALDAALAALPPGVCERYAASGWQLAFGEDAVTPDSSAEQFVRQAAMAWQAQPAGEGGSGKGTMLLTSPVLTSPSVSESLAAASQGQAKGAAAAAAGRDPYMKRFLGNFYCKTLSVAQAMEWVMLDSLRRDNTWG